jgi:hypothetical protein
MASAVIIDDYRNRVLIPTLIDHPITRIDYSERLTVINEILPYRVRFTTIGIEGISSSNPPGIGIQVIGYSNWIL